MTAAVRTGMRSVVLRRVCLSLVVGGIVWNVLYQDGLQHVVIWCLMLVLYGLLLAGAVQHVYRNVRVGRAETAAMLTTTVAFVVAMLLAPRQIGVIDRFYPTRPATGTAQVIDPSNPTSLLVPSSPSGYHRQAPIENAPLLDLFGRHRSVVVEPWLTFALVLGIVTMIGVCLQWVLVWRLGRYRAGVFNPAVGPAGLSTGATLDPPLGTSVTRPTPTPTPTPLKHAKPHRR